MNKSQLLGKRCLIAGQFSMKDDKISTQLNELTESIEKLGGIVVGQLFQRRGVSRANKPGGSKSTTLNAPLDAATYIGKGKAIELQMLSESTHADIIVFFNPLSGTQKRNLAELTQCEIIVSYQ